MGMFSKPKPPAVPKYQDVSAQQTTASEGAAEKSQQINSMSQSNPFGDLNYSYDPSTGSYRADQSYAPLQQMLFNLFQGTQGVAGGQGQNLLTGANYGAAQPADVIGDATHGMTGALTSDYLQTVGVQQEKQRNDMDARLRAQGLVPGMPGYDRQMQTFNFDKDAANANATSQFENQAFNQATSNYQLPALMAQQLASFGAPGSIMQNLWNTPQSQVQPANVIGAASNMTQANMDAYKQQMQNRSDTMKTIGQIAGAGVGLATGNPMMMMGLMGGLGGAGSGVTGSQMELANHMNRMGVG